MYDVLVIGSGPAGSASALLLARAGFRVGLVDRASFPRHKPCAEYVSPGSVQLLFGLVSEASLADTWAPLRGMRIVSPKGVSFVGRFDGVPGLVIRRELLDTVLVEAAAREGAEALHGATFETCVVSQDRCAVRVRTATGARNISARLVIGADGLNSRVARGLRVGRRGRLRRVAVVGHATGVRGLDGHGEMHVTNFGYVGLASLGNGLTNVSVVADLDRDRPFRPVGTWALNRLRGVGTLRDRVADAHFVAPPTAVGPFAYRTTRATADRMMLVGDAADFHDPFTGEGILAAIKGAHLVVKTAVGALVANQLHAPRLRRYDRDRLRAFTGKWTVERMVSFAVARPRVFEHVARRLSEQPGLADRLVRVTAGTLPPSNVLTPSYLWRLIR